MKLSHWAKQQGIGYRTAWEWFKAGKLPVSAIQTATGTILIQSAQNSVHQDREATVYVRVSSSDQRKDLDRQIARLVKFAQTQNLSVTQVVSEVGSGLNGHRPKLMKILRDEKIRVVLVEHRDRLMRFGCEYVESALAAQGRRLIVADSKELKDDLVQDMIEVLTSFCARLYGRRSAKNKAKKALEALEGKT